MASRIERWLSTVNSQQSSTSVPWTLDMDTPSISYTPPTTHPDAANPPLVLHVGPHSI